MAEELITMSATDVPTKQNPIISVLYQILTNNVTAVNKRRPVSPVGSKK